MSTEPQRWKLTQRIFSPPVAARGARETAKSLEPQPVG